MDTHHSHIAHQFQGYISFVIYLKAEVITVIKYKIGIHLVCIVKHYMHEVNLCPRVCRLGLKTTSCI